MSVLVVVEGEEANHPADQRLTWEASPLCTFSVVIKYTIEGGSHLHLCT